MKQVLPFLLLLLALNLYAQDSQPRFRGGLMVGFNLSQIDGDRSAGYNKLDPLAGLSTRIRLKDKSSLELGILYQGRGARNRVNIDQTAIPFKYKLQYISVPLTFQYHDWLDESGSYYKVGVELGAQYGYLLGADVEDEAAGSGLDKEISQFNKSNADLVAGLLFYPNRKSVIGFRFFQEFVQLLPLGVIQGKQYRQKSISFSYRFYFN